MALLSVAAAVYVEVIRGTPLLVQIFVIYYVLPVIGIRPAVPAALWALSVNTSAYVAEIFRLIDSIETGQMEAARSLGMTYPQVDAAGDPAAGGAAAAAADQ